MQLLRGCLINLAEYWDEDKRERLRKLGWVLCPLPGGNIWRPPGSQTTYVEAEAFRQLERLEREAKDNPQPKE